MTRHVRAVGPTKKPLLALIGEAPGREEESRGTPFCGPSGDLLDSMLSAAGISRFECYIDNVVNVRPKWNKLSNISKTEYTAHVMRLWKELKLIQPQVIVALGETALRAVASREKISLQRGKMIEVLKPNNETLFRVLPTFHPAYILRQYGDRPIVELDLKKAIRQARNPHIPEVDFSINPTVDDVISFVDKTRSEKTPIAFDIETIGPCTRTLGFAWSPTEAISIPLIRKGNHCWSHEDELIILQNLKSLVSDPAVPKYVQNFPFDGTMIARELGFDLQGLDLDTMYGYHLLYPELPKSLDFLSSIYTDFHLYWGKAKHSTDEANAIYNCYDCCATWISAQAIKAELIERSLWDFYKARVEPTVAALTRMQNRGIKVDEQSRERVRQETQAELDLSLETLHKDIGFELNPWSPKQVKELLYDKLKLPIQRKPNTKTITADENALKHLARKFPQHEPIITGILLCRRTRKLISTYIDQKLYQGRALTSFGITVSGRITSGKTWDGYGGNLQNIPRGSFRRLYVADKQNYLIKADLKQAEYMVFCWDAKVYEFIHEYTHNPDFDVHTLNASRIWGLPLDQVPKPQRYKAKQGVYAGNYKIGPLKMARMYEMPFKDAKHILLRYRAVRPELEVWWDKIRDQVRATRTLKNPLGRERIFFGRFDDELLRKALNHYCQSTVADIINQAVVTLDEQNVDLLLQVHDELVCQCPVSELLSTVAKVRSAMEIPIKFPDVEPPMVIPAEISYGFNWFDQKEIT